MCDGTNGTPDLRDRFIVGARQDDVGVAKTNIQGSLTQMGGSNTHTHGAGNYKSANHSHSLSRGDPTTGQFFSRGFVNSSMQVINRAVVSKISTRTPVTPYTTSDGSDSITGTSTRANNIPTFFALAYIMKL